MKTILLTLSCLVFFSPCFSQTDVLLDSISEPNPVIGIRCASNLTNSNSPLFIIDGVPMAKDSSLLDGIDPNDIVSVNVLKGVRAFGCYGTAGANGVVLIATKAAQNTEVSCKEYPFKVYKLYNENWTVIQDVYNAIQSKVPSVSITTDSNPIALPNIRMRGDDKTIVIVDGIRYDSSILNTFNPADIEHITISPDAAAANYLRNN